MNNADSQLTFSISTQVVKTCLFDLVYHQHSYITINNQYHEVHVNTVSQLKLYYLMFISADTTTLFLKILNKKSAISIASSCKLTKNSYRIQTTPFDITF